MQEASKKGSIFSSFFQKKDISGKRERLLKRDESFLHGTIIVERIASYCVRSTFVFTAMSLFRMSRTDVALVNGLCILLANVLSVILILMSKTRGGPKAAVLSSVVALVGASVAYYDGVVSQSIIWFSVSFAVMLGFGIAFTQACSMIMHEPRKYFRNVEDEYDLTPMAMAKAERDRFLKTKRVVHIIGFFVFLCAPLAAMRSESSVVATFALMFSFVMMFTIVNERKLMFFATGGSDSESEKVKKVSFKVEYGDVSWGMLIVLSVCAAPFFAVTGQVHTLWFFQGMQMERSVHGDFKVNPAQMIAFLQLFCLFFTVFVGKISGLINSRVRSVVQVAIGTIGIGFAVLSGYVIQRYVIFHAQESSGNGVTILLQVIPYFFLAIGEMFFSAGFLNSSYGCAGHRHFSIGLISFSISSSIAAIMNMSLAFVFDSNPLHWFFGSAISCGAMIVPLVVLTIMISSRYKTFDNVKKSAQLSENFE